MLDSLTLNQNRIDSLSDIKAASQSVDQSRLESFFNVKPEATPETWQDAFIELSILIGNCVVVWIVTRYLSKVVARSISGKTKTELDDHLVNHNFFSWTANIIQHFY